MPTLPAISDWGTAVVTSIALALSMIVAAIPKIIGFIIVLIIGWIVASAIAAIVSRLLRAVHFNDLAERSGISNFVRNMGLRTDASGALALAAEWFVRLITLVVAFDALGLPAISNIFNDILVWLPNLVVAIVVLVIGGLVANAFSDVVRGSTASAGLGNPNVLASIARYLVWAFAIVVAVNQIGIATALVNTLFMAFVGALALALGLAFGLGGRDTAAQLWRDWYERTRSLSSSQRMRPAMSGTMGNNHPMRRAEDRGETPVMGPHPMRRAADLATS